MVWEKIKMTTLNQWIESALYTILISGGGYVFHTSMKAFKDMREQISKAVTREEAQQMIDKEVKSFYEIIILKFNTVSNDVTEIKEILKQITVVSIKNDNKPAA